MTAQPIRVMGLKVKHAFRTPIAVVGDALPACIGLLHGARSKRKYGRSHATALPSDKA
jgi:hypothetical protein